MKGNRVFYFLAELGDKKIILGHLCRGYQVLRTKKRLVESDIGYAKQSSFSGPEFGGRSNTTFPSIIFVTSVATVLDVWYESKTFIVSWTLTIKVLEKIGIRNSRFNLNPKMCYSTHY